MTRFSLIIPSYNQREFIKDAVDSALAQRTAAKEIIVVDDASTDGSQEVLRQYGEAIRLICLEANQGVCVARNRGAALASGDYLVFLDGDDALLPWTLDVYERIVQAKRPKVMLGIRWSFRGELPVLSAAHSPHEIRIYEYPGVLDKDQPLGEPTAKTVERQAFLASRRWRQDGWPIEDTSLLLELCASGTAVLIVSPLIAFYRFHARNNSANIPRCLQALGRTIDNERSGGFAGGKAYRFRRRARIGERIVCHTKGALKAGLVWSAGRTLMRGWPMVLAAVIRRVALRLGRRRPCEIIPM